MSKDKGTATFEECPFFSHPSPGARAKEKAPKRDAFPSNYLTFGSSGFADGFGLSGIFEGFTICPLRDFGETLLNEGEQETSPVEALTISDIIPYYLPCQDAL